MARSRKAVKEGKPFDQIQLERELEEAKKAEESALKAKTKEVFEAIVKLVEKLGNDSILKVNEIAQKVGLLPKDAVGLVKKALEEHDKKVKRAEDDAKFESIREELTKVINRLIKRGTEWQAVEALAKKYGVRVGAVRHLTIQLQHEAWANKKPQQTSDQKTLARARRACEKKGIFSFNDKAVDAVKEEFKEEFMNYDEAVATAKAVFG